MESRARRGGVLRGGGGTGLLGEGPVGRGWDWDHLGAVLYGAALERSSPAGAGLCVERRAGDPAVPAGAGLEREQGRGRKPEAAAAPARRHGGR